MGVAGIVQARWYHKLWRHLAFFVFFSIIKGLRLYRSRGWQSRRKTAV